MSDTDWLLDSPQELTVDCIRKMKGAARGSAGVLIKYRLNDGTLISDFLLEKNRHAYAVKIGEKKKDQLKEACGSTSLQGCVNKKIKALIKKNAFGGFRVDEILSNELQ